MQTKKRRASQQAVAGLALAGALCGGERTVIAPAGAAKPVGPYSPALSINECVYVSGQGALDSEGRMPEGVEAHAKLALANVEANLAAAGLSFRHVVAAQLYVSDWKTIGLVERYWRKAFGGRGPATVRLGVARMPKGTEVEVTVVAVKELASKRRVAGGVNVGERVYLDAVYGSTRAEVEAKAKAAAGSRALVAAYVYSTRSRANDVIPVTALPGGAAWAVFGVAGARPSSTVYCNVVASREGDVEAQTEQAFYQLQACLEGQGAKLADLAATNVYLDDMDDFARMNAVYAKQFAGSYPTRTTIQPGRKSAGALVKISGVAVKP